MGFNFPASPAVGTVYPSTPTPGIPQYRWDGEKWKAVVTSAATATVIVSDTAPSTPIDGQLWWESDTGSLYVRYNDGDSVQWVIVGQMGSLSGLVRYDVDQALTDAQRVQTRKNAYAAPFDAFVCQNIAVNGGMEVSQETTSAVNIPNSVNTYICDQFLGSRSHAAGTAVFSGFTAAGGFSVGWRYLGLQSTTAFTAPGANDYAMIQTFIEGNRVERLFYGGGGAQTSVLGFWVYATIAGTACITVRNSAGNRSYVIPFTINTPATWEYKTITIPGDGAGTWLVDNGVGIRIGWCFGCGSTYITATPNTWLAGGPFFGSTGITNFFASNNNQVLLTGVSLTPGVQLPEAATAYRLIRPFQEELNLCKRYFNKSFFTWRTKAAAANDIFAMQVNFPVQMRVPPVIALSGSSRSNVTNPAFVNNADGVSAGFQVTATAAGDAYVYNEAVSYDSRLQ